MAWGGGRAPTESPEALREPERWWEGRQGRGDTDHTIFQVPAPFPSTPTPPPNTIPGLIFSIAALTLVTPCHPTYTAGGCCAGAVIPSAERWDPAPPWAPPHSPRGAYGQPGAPLQPG